MTINGDSVQHTALRVHEFAMAQDLLCCAKAEAVELCRSITESATPSLRQMLYAFLQDELQLQEEIAEYNMAQGFYRPYLDPVEQIEHDLHLASAQPVPDRAPQA